jgi:hypothetical protein
VFPTLKQLPKASGRPVVLRLRRGPGSTSSPPRGDPAQAADGIKTRVAAATARADKLPQAILAKAFRGEQVPTEAKLAPKEGRDYEPASALLARIRAARNASEAASKPARRSRVPAATPAPARAKPARQRTNGRTARSR